MASITPYFDDARELTYTVGATPVVGGRLVESSTPGDRIAVPASAGSLTVKGVALYDQVVGKKVAVARDQVLPVVASGAIAAGVKLIAGAAGVVVAAGATPDARTIVGEALESAVDGATLRALIY